MPISAVYRSSSWAFHSSQLSSNFCSVLEAGMNKMCQEMGVFGDGLP